MTITSEQVAHPELVGGATTALHSHTGGGALGDLVPSKLVSTGNITLDTNTCATVVGDFEIANTHILELTAGSVFEIL